MAASEGTALAVWQADADVLHHALVFVIEDVAVQHVFPDIALVASAHHNCVDAFRIGLGRDQTLNPERIFPNPLQPRILRVRRATSIIDGPCEADIPAVRVENLDDLEGIHRVRREVGAFQPVF